MLGTILMGGAVEGQPAPGVPGGQAIEAFEVPIRAGVATFELPPEFSDHEVVLIVSALATEGTFAARCSLSPDQEGAGLLDLRSMGAEIPIEDLARPIALSPSALIDETLRNNRPAEPGHPMLRRGFSVRVRPGDPRSPSHYDLVDARLRAVGERIQVFVDDDDLALVGDDVLRTLVTSFDRRIHPRLETRIGTALDVDRDGRFTVLLSRRISLPFPQGSHVDGYFRASDLDHDLPRPLSNRADMIYLNAELQAGPYLETVLAHEYAHAVLESRRREQGGSLLEESWLDEAMAHLCEEIVGQSTSNLDYRVSAFLSEPNRSCVIVENEHRPGRFRSHGNRGASYLFLRWCAETIGDAFLLRLCTQGEVGIANLERAAGLPFHELYRRWTITNALESLGIPRDCGERFHLLGTLGDWPMGGVRFAVVDEETPEQFFSLEGTSSQYLRLSLSSGTSRHVAVHCDPAALPQLTVLLVPQKHPHVAIDVVVKEYGPELSTLVARIEERAGLSTALEQLSWEPGVSAATLPRSSLAAWMLHGDALHSLFPQKNIAPGERLTSLPFSIPSDQLSSAPLIFRLTSRTNDGNRSVSWAELSPQTPPGPTHALRSASLERPRVSSPGPRTLPPP
ncbi:hypothetical protein [Tautonia marina]|uniref:hypothetical protein n=1 Tax=Tautonia marina TaxID=2653855 RepID=UPI0012604E92|nr:hypothetical protein [Tautonia marina]